MKSYITDIFDYYSFDNSDKFYETKLKSHETNSSIYNYLVNSSNLPFNEVVELYKIVIYKQYIKIYKTLCDNLPAIIYIFQGLLVKLVDNNTYNTQEKSKSDKSHSDMIIFLLNNTSENDLHIILYNSVDYFNDKFMLIICSKKPNMLYKLVLSVNDRIKHNLVNMLMNSSFSTSSCLLYLMIYNTNISINDLSDEIKTYMYLYELIYKKIKYIIPKGDIINIVSNIIIYYDKFRLYKLNVDYKNNKIRKINYELIYDIFNTLINRYIITNQDIARVISNLDFNLILYFLYISTDLRIDQYIKDTINTKEHGLFDKIVCKNKYRKFIEYDVINIDISKYVGENINNLDNTNTDNNNRIMNNFTDKDSQECLDNMNKDIDDILDEISLININDDSSRRSEKVTTKGLEIDELISDIIESVCNIKNKELRTSLTNKLINLSTIKTNKYKLLQKIVIIACKNKDLDLVRYIICNYSINFIDNNLIYYHVKHNFDNNDLFVKSILYLCGISDKFNL